MLDKFPKVYAFFISTMYKAWLDNTYTDLYNTIY